jgi:uncharacterized protein (DUF2235 family)
MTDPAELARETLRSFEAERPQAVRLAEVASVALKIDANLLRRLRIELLPWVDVGAEAHLWFSDLVESRGPVVVVLDAHVAILLGERLARDPAGLERVMAITSEAHAHEPPTIQAEERINGLALRRDVGAGTEIDRELERALRALDAAAPQAREIARWVARAAPRFHPNVRRRPKAQMLELMASLVLGDQRVYEEPGAIPVPLDDLGWDVPASALHNPVVVGVDLLEDGVLFHVPARGSNLLKVPGTDPLLMTLGWRAGATDLERTVTVADRKLVPLEGSPREVVLASISGERYRLIAGEPADAATATPGPSRPGTGVPITCRRVGLSPSDGPTAYAVTARLFVTAARPFLGTADAGERVGSAAVLRARAQLRRADARKRMAALLKDYEVVGQATPEDEFLFLRPRDPGAVEPPFSPASAGPTGLSVSVIGYQDGRFAAVAARIVPSRGEAAHLELALSSSDMAGWQQRFLGAPVLGASQMGELVLGIVVSGPWLASQPQVLRVVPQAAINAAMTRLDAPAAAPAGAEPRDPNRSRTVRRLVLCFDGAWSSPEQTESEASNVRRLFDATATEQTGSVQVKWYGESAASGFQRLIGGAIGAGMATRIKTGYAWLAQNFNDGDEVFFFGFSQGAFLCRSLTGMIARIGLLRADAALPALVDQAYELYRSQSDPSRQRVDEFRSRHARRITVKFIGVWETVGALGIPFLGALGNLAGLAGFQNTRLPAIVENAYHALAVDERRRMFRPTLWEGPVGPGQRLEQRWFAGSHGDVGGGHPERALADLSLAWMRRKAAEHGLMFETTPSTGGDPLGPLHISGEDDRPIGVTPSGNEVIDESVLVRMKAMEDYRPRNVIDYLERQGRSSPA